MLTDLGSSLFATIQGDVGPDGTVQHVYVQNRAWLPIQVNYTRLVDGMQFSQTYSGRQVVTHDARFFPFMPNQLQASVSLVWQPWRWW